MKYIEDWQNWKLRCHFCGQRKSVKYAMRSKGRVVACCNRCALKMLTIHMEEKVDERN